MPFFLLESRRDMRLRVLMHPRIEHVETRNVITIESGSPLRDEVELVNKHEIGYIIALEKGNPLGL